MTYHLVELAPQLLHALAAVGHKRLLVLGLGSLGLGRRTQHLALVFHNTNAHFGRRIRVFRRILHLEAQGRVCLAFFVVFWDDTNTELLLRDFCVC